MAKTFNPTHNFNGKPVEVWHSSRKTASTNRRISWVEFTAYDEAGNKYETKADMFIAL